MDNSFKSLVEASNSLLILLPTKPYFDEVAAALSLYMAIKKEKEVGIVCPAPMLVEFNRLVDVDKVTSELGSKNLVIRFKDYLATGIERVSYDIENGEFRLAVIPKPGVAAPGKNQVDISYSGLSANGVILIGGANESHFTALSSKEMLGAKLIHIGTKPLAVGQDKTVISFAHPASSISEVTANLIKQSGYFIDPDMATNLLLGIEVGSNNYASLDVTADTFQVVADLLRAGGRRQGERLSRSSFPPGSIPGEVLLRQEKVKKEVLDEPEKPPEDWLGPKIYKGTSVS